MKLSKVLLIPAVILALAACGKPDAPTTPSISIKGSNTLSIPADAYTGTLLLTASLSWTGSPITPPNGNCISPAERRSTSPERT